EGPRLPAAWEPVATSLRSEGTTILAMARAGTKRFEGSRAAEAPRLDLQLLGGFRASIDGGTVPADAWRYRRAAALVKRLALAPRHRLTRDEIIEALWPDVDADAGATNVRE